MKKLRYFFETLLIESAAWIMPRLPRWLILALSRGIGSIAYLADKRGRTTALENLRCAFGDRYTLKERQHIARGSYQVFARTFFDLFWSSKLTAETWQKHFDIRLHDEQAEQQAREKGGVWVTPHFGNFEFLSLTWGYRGLPYTVVAQNFKNPGLTPIFNRLRSHSGQTVIAQESAILKLMKLLKRGGFVGMLVDLNIEPGRTSAAIQCFGLWTSVPTLHVQLTQRLGLAIIPSICLPLPDGRYEVSTLADIHPKPGDDIQGLTQRAWDHFETVIREHPECWMWMYKHWRYRPVGVPGVPHPDYPLYSNYSQALKDMIPEALSPK
ncbi:lysophospholipid acyltransferase family protein [Prosthecobacter sp.]|uniref:lysophospholipid acyltransferase family protein n=1 Tax=Prosthecobacter sp. TaxID=1965333 RepID=UPI002ABB4746|nr:lysophospholipid acyltransferase family protein [Prosthecobacter sp.]MDZ4404089.1 lysophospholipid acyltransferase family protein [Prosthecobacter sp.]